MSQPEFKEVAWLLMLIPFGIVSGTGVVFIYYAWRRACQLRRQEEEREFHALTGSGSFSLSQQIFEQPTRWLAVKTNDPLAVQEALHLNHPTPCSLEDGLSGARQDKLFISPPIDGWVLVIGAAMPGPFEDVDQCFHFLTAISREIGQVQFFCANRAVNHHAWVVMERGRVFRAYAWAGETLWNQGPITAAEREFGVVCPDYGIDASAGYLKDKLALNCEKLGQLAARWSVDPATLYSKDWKGEGITGDLSSSS